MSHDATPWNHIPPPHERGIGPVRCPRCRKEEPEERRDLHTCDPHAVAICGEQARDLAELAAENAALRTRCDGLERAVFELTTVDAAC